MPRIFCINRGVNGLKEDRENRLHKLKTTVCRVCQKVDAEKYNYMRTAPHFLVQVMISYLPENGVQFAFVGVCFYFTGATENTGRA